MNKYEVTFQDNKTTLVYSDSYMEEYSPQYTGGISMYSSVSYVSGEFINFYTNGNEYYKHGEEYIPKSKELVASIKKDTVKSVKKIS